jgi:hypothetical protein
MNHDAMQFDKVLSDGQLERMGVNPSLYPGIQVCLRPIANSRYTDRNVVFRALDSEMLGVGTSRLMHLAGTAEIRLGLSQTRRVEDWVLGRPGRGAPDARATIDGQLTVIEFDTCTYGPLAVQKKIDAFRAEGRVVWGTTSRSRAERMAQKYPDVEVLYVPWWEGVEERASALAG